MSPGNRPYWGSQFTDRLAEAIAARVRAHGAQQDAGAVAELVRTEAAAAGITDKPFADAMASAKQAARFAADLTAVFLLTERTAL